MLLNDELLKNRYDSPSGNYWRSGKWVLSIWHHFKLPVRLTFVWNKESLNGILLLDDRENLKLAIIRKLEQQYSFSERKDRLCKQLAISPYLLERNITEINADLQRFGLINEMEISEK